MRFCEYKDAFGKPNTGAHSVKIYNIAIIDFLITFIAAYFFFVIGNSWGLEIGGLGIGEFSISSLIGFSAENGKSPPD